MTFLKNVTSKAITKSYQGHIFVRIEQK